MFRRALFNLTLWFFGVIVLISLVFSFALYEVATREVYFGLRPPNQSSGILLQRGIIDDGQAYQAFRESRVQESRERTLTNLIYFNIYIFLIGGCLSYLLAKYTLEPIEEAHLREKRFTGDASHELRTPLSAMRSEIEVALRGQKLDEQEARNLLKSNLEEIDKLTILSDGLLKLARQTKLSENVLSDVDLRKVTTEAIKSLEKATDSKMIKIITDFEDIKIQAEPLMIRELLTIILDNSIKYSSEGKEVEVSIKRIDHSAQITVEDHGMGIPASDLPHVFDRFYRADISRSVIAGHGLGLSIAKQIVSLHNGKIQAHSKQGAGTMVSIILPLRQA